MNGNKWKRRGVRKHTRMETLSMNGRDLKIFLENFGAEVGFPVAFAREVCYNRSNVVTSHGSANDFRLNLRRIDCHEQQRYSENLRRGI